MVVSGIPEAKEDHALRLGCFAIEMRDSLHKYNKEKHPKYPLVRFSFSVAKQPWVRFLNGDDNMKWL